jgi:hypothetical protein
MMFCQAMTLWYAPPLDKFGQQIFVGVSESNLFAICNNTFSKWWGSMEDGL